MSVEVRTVIGTPAVGNFGSTGGTPIVIDTASARSYFLGPGDVVTQLGQVTGVTTQTAATYTVLASDRDLIANLAGTVTYTLPAPSTANTGRRINMRTIQAQTAVSASANVVPLVGGAAGTAILAATAGKWAELVSDGTNYQIMAAN